jgi:hypothetical protein
MQEYVSHVCGSLVSKVLFSVSRYYMVEIMGGVNSSKTCRD